MGDAGRAFVRVGGHSGKCLVHQAPHGPRQKPALVPVPRTEVPLIEAVAMISQRNRLSTNHFFCPLEALSGALEASACANSWHCVKLPENTWIV
jgi:hypothetical protein